MHKLPVGVLGASGFAGRVLCDLIAVHPRLELSFAAASEQRGDRISAGGRSFPIIAADDAPIDRCALVFTALPHGVSAPWVQRVAATGAKVVDLSSDFRPGSGSTEPPVATSSGLTAPVGVGAPHGLTAPHALTAPCGLVAPYGLTEHAREALRESQVVANPGCYATAILIALLPLVERGLIPAGAMVAVSAASGTTGAGASPRADLLFSEITENFRAYGVGNTHRHLAEMRAMLARAGGDLDLVFTPHLLPVARGILATMVVPLTQPLDDPLEPWRTRYAGEPFIRVGEATPSLRDVVYRNVVRVSATPAAGTRTPALIVTTAIDNLLKGAAGQALQNANVLLGIDEALGLPA